jgi:hypothetical protein
MAETYILPQRIEAYQPKAKRPWTAPLDGRRCDLCDEMLTAQKRPLACGLEHMTSIEEWAARPRLGLWTR